MTTAYLGHLFLMSLYITVLHTIPAPANLTVVSHNFRHVLQWIPGTGSPPGTVFNFRQHCRVGNAIVRLNITNTTVDVSDTIEDIYSPCTFTVWASLNNKTSSKVKKEFIPYEETIIGPPVISLSGCGNCLNIGISLPEETTITKQMRQFYRSGYFNISWKKAGQSEAEQIIPFKNQLVLENLQPGAQYCVRVVPQINANMKTQASAWQCEHTSKVEPRGGLYLMSMSLGASVPGVAVLLLAAALVYTGFLCKLKTPPLISLSNMVKAHYLIPEETICDQVSSTEAQFNSASKHCPSSSSPLHVEQHEDNYANKDDTDEEEDEEEEDKGNYMGCVIDDSGSETKRGRSLHFSGEARQAAIEEIHHHEHECRDKLTSDVCDDRSRHTNTRPESEGTEDVSGNISLFSVTLRALGAQGNELCTPLLLQPGLGLSTAEEHTEEEEELLQPGLGLSTAEDHTEEEEELLRDHTHTELRPDVDSPSEYMVSHTGNTSELQRSSSEETDCDTDYITR